MTVQARTYLYYAHHDIITTVGEYVGLVVAGVVLCGVGGRVWMRQVLAYRTVR